VDRDLSLITLKCLEKDPTRRYASAEYLATDLKRWQNGEPVTARRAGLIRRTRKWAARNPIPAVLLLTAVLTATVVGALLLRTRAALAEARWQMYVSALQLATRDAEEHNLDQCQAQLNRAPEEWRGWEWQHLNRIAHPEAAVWEPQLGGMNIVGTPDGNTLLVRTSSTKCIAALIDPETGKKMVEFAAPPAMQNNILNALVSVSADGQRIVVGDHTILGLYKRDGTLIKTFGWPAGQLVLGMDLDSNGRRLAVITQDQHLQVRDLETGEFLFDQRREDVMSYQPRWQNGHLVALYKHGLGIDTLPDPKQRRDLSFQEMGKFLQGGLQTEASAFDGLAVRPDGKVAALGGIGMVVLIDLETMKPIRKLECETAVRSPKKVVNLQALVFSPDGRHLAGCSPLDRAVRVWDVGAPLPTGVHYGHSQFPAGAAFLPGGSRVVTVGWDVKARVYEVLNKSYPHPLPNSGKKNIATYLEVSRDGRFLAVGGDEGYVSLYDTQTEKLVWHVRPATREITQLTFSPDGTKIGVAPGWHHSHSGRGAALAQVNREAAVLSTASGELLFKLPAAPGEWSMVKSISFRHDGKRILTASGHTDAGVDTVREWDAETGQHLADLDVGYARRRQAGMAGSTTGVAYDPSGRDEFVATGDANVLTRLSSAADGSYRRDLGLGNTFFNLFWVGYSREGRFIVAHDHTELGVWERDVSLTKRNHPVEPCENRFWLKNLPLFWQVAVSPDGLRLALASEKFLVIRSTITGSELVRIPVDGCYSVAFHPDGRKLYAGSGGDVVCFDP
jgi:WD40 repeat protein